jgi:hypothetical protein
MRYEELLAAELSREAGREPETDLYGKLLASFLVGGNFGLARMLLANNTLDRYVSTALQVVDFAIEKFPPRAEFERLRHPRRSARRKTARRRATSWQTASV